MIKIKSLTKKFGDKVAVSDLDIHVEKGEIYGFLGPNGAGKTTTIKIMVGLLFPTSGSVEIAGFDLLKDAKKIKKITGYIPDRPYLYEKLTGRELLKFISEIFEVSESIYKEKSEKLLSMFDLSDRADQLIETYSYGMRQKIAISSALIHDPELIIVDEPIVGLDPKGIRQIKDLFKELSSKEGVTIFMSTHTLGIAEELCDRVGIINNGRLITQLTKSELKKEIPVPSSVLEDVFLTITSEENPDKNKGL
jgi:ABC-2 type transport system ATP-binding protein